jgi:hypothetical protein
MPEGVDCMNLSAKRKQADSVLSRAESDDSGQTAVTAGAAAPLHKKSFPNVLGDVL